MLSVIDQCLILWLPVRGRSCHPDIRCVFLRHEIEAKANKLVGFVHRASWYIQSTQTRRTLCLSIVRCHLGYATKVWSPLSIVLLKRVENEALKLPFPCDVTYMTRLQLTNLLPISYWHEFLDIVLFYKAVNNLAFIDSEAL